MKIIIINGPCGVGKSTIAEKLHQDFPMSFLMDIDGLRRLFSGYREHQDESREATIVLSEAILSACLKMGRDVIIEKMLYEHSILDSFHEAGRKYGADIKEIILWASKDIVMERADKRGYKEGGLFTPEKCDFFWEEVNKIKDERANAIIIDTTNLSEEEVYDQVRKIVK